MTTTRATETFRRFRRLLYDRMGDITCLITGPSGTGKELVAAIALGMALAQERERAAAPSKWKMHGRRQTMVGRLGGGVG